jgi:hypothetical protein
MCYILQRRTNQRETDHGTLHNDEGLYNLARERKTYEAFRDEMREMGVTETPDGVAYNDSGLNIKELDRMIKELG